jgi:hypothetical protein
VWFGFDTTNPAEALFALVSARTVKGAPSASAPVSTMIANPFIFGLPFLIYELMRNLFQKKYPAGSAYIADEKVPGRRAFLTCVRSWTDENGFWMIGTPFCLGSSPLSA